MRGTHLMASLGNPRRATNIKRCLMDWTRVCGQDISANLHI